MKSQLFQEESRGLINLHGGTNINRIMDVVFVHGVIGNAFSTWMSDKSNEDTLWPKWIAVDLPDIGIWSIGYPAALSEWKEESLPITKRAKWINNSLKIKRLGERPLVFITHSMGGIIVKEMMRCSSDSADEEIKQIFRQTRGIVFMAVPHFGVKLANLANYRAAIGLLGLNSFIKELSYENPWIMELDNWFKANGNGRVKREDLIEARNILRHFRLLRSRIFGILKFGDDSSSDKGGISHDEDHISICKPINCEDPVYLTVLHLLENCRIEIYKEQNPLDYGEIWINIEKQKNRIVFNKKDNLIFFPWNNPETSDYFRKKGNSNLSHWFNLRNSSEDLWYAFKNLHYLMNEVYKSPRHKHDYGILGKEFDNVQTKFEDFRKIVDKSPPEVNRAECITVLSRINECGDYFNKVISDKTDSDELGIAMQFVERICLWCLACRNFTIDIIKDHFSKLDQENGTAKSRRN